MMAVRLTKDPIFANIGLGRRIDIGLVDPAAVDFRLMASTLSKQARFGARNEGPHALSAAQHAVQGAQAILRETNDMRLAGLCFCCATAISFSSMAAAARPSN